MKFFITCALALFIIGQSQMVSAQAKVYPYKVGYQYGLADQKGTLIVEPQFSEVKFHLLKYSEGDYVLAVKKDELWGIYSSDGEKIISPKMTNYGVSVAYSNTYDAQGNPTQVPALYQILDKGENHYVFYHPSFRKKHYTTFININEATKGRKNVRTEYNISTNGFVKVATTDRQINFIDTTGAILFENGFYDGRVINQHFLIASNEAEKYALFNTDGTRLTDFIYRNQDFISGQRPDFLRLCRQKEGETDRSFWRYSVIGTSGEIVLEDKKDIAFIAKDFIIANNDDYSGVYNYKGEELFSYPKAKISQSRIKDPGRLLVQTQNYKTGLIDYQGKLLIDTSYADIYKLTDGGYILQEKWKAAVVDDELNEIFSMDSTRIHEFENGMYQIEKIEGYGYLRGIVSAKGAILITPQFNRIISVQTCPDLVLVKLKNENSLIDINGNTVIPFTTDRIQANCKRGIFYSFSDSMSVNYDRSGNVIVSNGEQRSSMGSRRPSRMVTKAGVTKSMEPYNFFSNEDEKQGRVIFFGRKKTKETKADYINVVVNDKGIDIAPEGYGVPENFTYNKTGENGGVRVANIEDMLSNERRFRVGVIDFDGNWLIKPAYQNISQVANELFVVGNDKMETVLHNRYGKKISNESYDYFERDANEEVHNNRIVIGKLYDKEAFKKRMDEVKDQDAFDKLIKDWSRGRMPKFMYGYMDIDANEIIKPQYLEADPFRFTYTTVSGIENGKTFSDIIDLNGKVLLHTNYSEMEILHSDSTRIKVKDGDFYGVINMKGEVLVKPIYKQLQIKNKFLVARDTANCYVLSGDKKLRIGPKGNRIDIKSINANFYYSKIMDKWPSGESRSLYAVFDDEGNFYGDYSDIAYGMGEAISTRGFGFSVPPGFMVINNGHNQLPILVDFVNGLVFEQKE